MLLPRLADCTREGRPGKVVCVSTMAARSRRTEALALPSLLPRATAPPRNHHNPGSTLAHWQVPLTHVCPVAQSFGRKHWTHAPAWHVGLAEGQSVFDRQATQLPSGEHSVLGADVQLALERHSTHTLVAVLQSDAVPKH
jgi:hypothetical protein